jgi:hypothetical protein
MVVLFVLITLNFAWLTVRIDQRGVSIGYGIIRQHIRWEDIEDCYQDQAWAVRYGGWGIRLGWYGPNWRLVYNTLFDPRVVLRRRSGFVKEIAFSTGNPDQVMAIVRDRLGLH